MSDQLWNDAAQTIINAGAFPLPLTDTVVETLKTLMTEEQAELILNFEKPMNWDEIKAKSGYEDDVLKKILDDLMNNAIMTGIPSSSTGVMVYRLLPMLPGVYEYALMRGGKTEKDRKIARLIEQYYCEITEMGQEHYDFIMPALKEGPAISRIIPVKSQVAQDAEEVVFPIEEVDAIVEKYEPIAVSTCYCRHEKDLNGKPCKTTDQRENCLFFGKTAQFGIDHKYARQITKAEAKKILRAAEDDGLIHKAFHAKNDPHKDEEAICNCCGCCCASIELYRRGGFAINTISSHVAVVNTEECTSCGVCVDACHLDAISLDDVAVIDEDKCIGCGVCAHLCEFKAISLNKVELKKVFIEPGKAN